LKDQMAQMAQMACMDHVAPAATSLSVGQG
jgi:hypothetical protein